MVGVWPPKDMLVVFQHNSRRLNSQEESLCERCCCDISLQKFSRAPSPSLLKFDALPAKVRVGQNGRIR